MARVVDKLKEVGRVPHDFQLGQCPRSTAFTLSRTTDSLVGRELEVETVLASLRQHR